MFLTKISPAHNRVQEADAIAACAEAINCAPTLVVAWHNLSVSYQRLDEQALSGRAEHIKLAIVAVQAGQASAEHWLLVAREVWARHGQREQSRQCVKQVLALAPESLPGLALAAELALDDGDLPLAEDYLARLQAIDPDYLDAFPLHARLSQAHGRPDEARERLRAYLDTAGEQIDYAACMQMAELFADLEDPDYAEQAYLRAADATREHWVPLCHRAETVWRLAGDTARAEELFVDHLLNDPEAGRHALVYLLDGELALETGDFLRCREDMERCRGQFDFVSLAEAERQRWVTLRERCL